MTRASSTSGTEYEENSRAETETSGLGEGCKLKIEIDGDGNVNAVSIHKGGTGYIVGETVTVKGSEIGAADGDDDLVFDITDASAIIVPTAIETIRTIDYKVQAPGTQEDPGEWDDPNPLKLLGYIVNFYLCPSNTVFIPESAYFIGGIVSDVKEGGRSQLFTLPEILAPVTGVGSIEAEGGEVKPTYGRALYIPKGQCLWAAAVQNYLPDGKIDDAAFAPLACVQGGYY